MPYYLGQTAGLWPRPPRRVPESNARQRRRGERGGVHSERAPHEVLNGSYLARRCRAGFSIENVARSTGETDTLRIPRDHTAEPEPDSGF
jgi:hypothetical protein